MYVSDLPQRDVVMAAQAGDPAALDSLVSGYLPLVYNVVARAADSDLDVDDVVQETMLRVVAGLPELRAADRFRSWAVSIALSQLAEARRQARARRVRTAPVTADDVDWLDPSSDFVGFSILREALSQEQREVLGAAAWLDQGFRDLFSLWCLELSGRLGRTELAASLTESGRHVAVRVQRMRAQLDTARGVVRALRANPPCADLTSIVLAWDGTPSPLWRKRIGRHLRGCDDCSALSARLVPAERLLVGVPLIVVPAALAGRLTPGIGVTRVEQLTGARVGGHAGKVGGAHAGKATLLLGVGTKTAAVAVTAVILAAGTLGYANVRSNQPGPEHHSVAAAWTYHPSASPRTTPSPTRSAAAVTPRRTAPAPAKSTPAPTATSNFRSRVPRIPTVSSATELGPITQNGRVAGRDNGQSTRYGSRSVWLFDDTTLKNPWGFLSNSGAATTDLDAANGITLTSGNPVTVRPTQTPVQLLPLTAAEKAFEARHSKSAGCTSADQYCGATFGFWPGPVIADPARHRVLVFYGKLCRGGAAGTPCSGPLGNGLGTGIAAINMSTGQVSRLAAVLGPAVSSVEGLDRTMFFPPSGGFSAAALVVNGVVYAYGDCSYGCKLGRVPLAELTDRAAWRFYTSGHTWSSQPGSAVALIAPGAAGQSVFYDAALKAYLNVFMPFASNTVQFQVGGSPFGPWSKSKTALQTRATGAANYALFAHPEYAQLNGLVQYLSYFNPASGNQQLVRLRFAPDQQP